MVSVTLQCKNADVAMYMVAIYSMYENCGGDNLHVGEVLPQAIAFLRDQVKDAVTDVEDKVKNLPRFYYGNCEKPILDYGEFEWNIIQDFINPKGGRRQCTRES